MMSRRHKSAPRYRVRHVFAHKGTRYGPWNADEVSRLPEDFREAMEKRGRIEVIPATVASEPLNEEQSDERDESGS